MYNKYTMKFIHTADLHVDSKIDYLPSSLSAIRREEVLHSFERLCEYASKNQITAVIVAGDLFDCNKVTKKAIERVKNAISLCKGVDFLYLQGNHDEFTQEDIFDDFPSNFKPFQKGLSSFKYGNVVVSGIVDTNNTLPFLYEQISLNKDDFNILAMHGEVVDYKGKSKNGTISLPMLRDRNIDYLALGHYHSFSQGQLDLRGKYAYSGCLDGRGFDELGQKGFVVIDTDNKHFSFVTFSSRQYLEKTFDLANYSTWVNARAEIIQTLKAESDKSNVIKVVLSGDVLQDFNLDKNELEQRLREYFFYAKVEDKTVLKLTEQDYLLDKTVKGEFLRLVWESDLTDDQKKNVISCGINALRGEELL